MNTSSDITAVIPVIGDKWLRSILSNMASDDNKPAEIIVIDNSGGRSVMEICSSFVDSLPIRYLPQQVNLGVNASWNLSLAESKTVLVSILNDDLVLPLGFFAMIQRTFEAYPQVGFVIPSTIGPNVPGAGANLPWLGGVPTDIMCSDGRPEVIPLVEREGGWAMTVAKYLMKPIPDSLFTFYGDDFLFKCVIEQGFLALKILNCRIYHHVGISLDLNERERLNLPKIETEQRAWRRILATSRMQIS